MFSEWDVGELPATLNFQFALPASSASETDLISNRDRSIYGVLGNSRQIIASISGKLMGQVTRMQQVEFHSTSMRTARLIK
jgi:hypothetical protein